MALIACPDCGHEISETAHRCSECDFAPTLRDVLIAESRQTSRSDSVIIVLLMGIAFWTGRGCERMELDMSSPADGEPQAALAAEPSADRDAAGGESSSVDSVTEEPADEDEAAVDFQVR